jgi:hypothetical protein
MSWSSGQTRPNRPRLGVHALTQHAAIIFEIEKTKPSMVLQTSTVRSTVQILYVHNTNTMIFFIKKYLNYP